MGGLYNPGGKVPRDRKTPQAPSSPRGISKANDVGLVRVNLNVNQQTATMLREAAERHETSITEIIRRAVGVYDHIDRAVGRGETVQTINGDAVATLVILR